MHVTGCDYRLAQFLPDLANPSDDIPQLLGAGYKSFVHEMHVHRQRLDFQHIVEFGDFNRLFNRFVQHSLEEFAALASRDDQQTVAQLRQLRLGYAGNTFKVFRMRHRDQFVQILLPSCIKCINPAVERTGVGQIGADIIIQPVQHRQVFQLLGVCQQPVQDASERNGIVNRPVMALEQHLVLIGQRVQTVILHRRMQQAGKLQGIEERVRQLLPSVLQQRCLNKAHIKPCVMRDQHAVTDKFNELVEYRLEIRRILNHFIRNIRQLLNMIWNFLMRIDES
ncbi:hypothetical protein D3C71_1488280 [compost metagenome]